MFGSWVRRIGFWTLDALRGGTVRKNYKEIKEYNDGSITNDKQLMNLVEHALVNVPFYQSKKIETFSNIKFDLVLYSTPPITFYRVVKYIKKRDGAKTYLLLKDIFPQNAVDLGMLRKNGITAGIYKYFRAKEKKLYSISDHIGCMSKANVDYIINHNPEVSPNKVEECPNSIEIIENSISTTERESIRRKYNIPLDKTVFVYGGNLGKPQGIPFLIECLRNTKNDRAYFLIVGGGSEYGLLKQYIDNERPQNVKLMATLPKEDYDSMVGACDVGMIFLDHRFSIPNFPSRLLAYMQAKLPVLAATDTNSDIKEMLYRAGCGYWCHSNDTNGFVETVDMFINSDLKRMGVNSWIALNEHYSVDRAYDVIMHSCCDNVKGGRK